MNATTALAPLIPDITLRVRRVEVAQGKWGQDKALLLALLAAFALHAAIFAWLAEQPEPAPQPGLPSDAIAVEILPPSELPHAPTAPAPPAPAESVPAPPEALLPPPAAAPPPQPRASRPAPRPNQR